MTQSIRTLRYRLSHQAVHIDFLRLRCGTEKRFMHGIRTVRERAGMIHSFIAFSEWDALIVVPCSQLYPPTLTDIYSNPDVAASVSGTSGYFAYLWEHDINAHWQETLAVVAESGPTILMSLRFVDSFRQEIGLGAEILFCQRLTKIIEKFPGVRAVVAHSLGWNDVMLLIHATEDAGRLIALSKEIRLMTLSDCIGKRSKIKFTLPLDAPIFSASYSHLLGSLEAYAEDRLSFGKLSRMIESARLLVRVAPPHEQNVRAFMKEEMRQTPIDSEMGHYSVSVDISELARKKQSRSAIDFIGATRRFIGELRGGEPDSYAETTSIFRFKENGPAVQRPHPVATNALEADAKAIMNLLRSVPDLLRERGASSMTSHRFVSVLTTMLDHLFDPVRSSVVSHLSRFAATIPDRIRELNLDGINDLCHVLEYAVGQAIDGIAQFQHDANALGLSGRGGYSRLIAAVEWYMRSTLESLAINTELPLITFGLRTGNAGSTGRYQIDIPFNVLFSPSRWHVILHEIGHLAWIHSFGWMMESLAIYTAMETEIAAQIEREIKGGSKLRDALRALPGEQVQVEFLRVREIVRELFPNYLIFALPCDGNVEEYDELVLRPLITTAHSSSLSRELLVRVVTHCLLEIMQNALDAGARERQARKDADLAVTRTMKDTVKRDNAIEAASRKAAVERAATWWRIWDELMHESDEDATVRIEAAASSIHATLLQIDADSRAREERGSSRREPESRRTVRLQEGVAATLLILDSDTFKGAVREALHSVITVLSLRGKLFQGLADDDLAPHLFGVLLDRIDEARQVQSDPDYERWVGQQFASWVHAGEVLTRHRDASNWSRLLVGSRKAIRAGDRGQIMRAELSVLLSMWHHATTADHRDYKLLDDILWTLKVVREMEPTAPPG